MWLALPVAGGVAAALAQEVAAPPAGQPTRQRMLAAATRVGALAGWRHFACFADRVARTESRHNPRAGSPRRNDARGLFGFRPRTAAAGRFPWIQLAPNLVLLGPPELQVAVLADQADLLIRKWGARSWLDVRAGLAYPRLASGAGADERRQLTERNWAAAGKVIPGCPGLDAEVPTPIKHVGAASLAAAATGVTWRP